MPKVSGPKYNEKQYALQRVGLAKSPKDGWPSKDNVQRGGLLGGELDGELEEETEVVSRLEYGEEAVYLFWRQVHLC